MYKNDEKQRISLIILKMILPITFIIFLGLSFWYTDIFDPAVGSFILISWILAILLFLFIAIFLGIIKLINKNTDFTMYISIAFCSIIILTILNSITILTESIPKSSRGGYRLAICLLDEKNCQEPDQIFLSNYNKSIGNKIALAQDLINKIMLKNHFRGQIIKIHYPNINNKNPFFYYNDDYGLKIKYEVEKAEGKCGANNTTDPDIANCVILVDINSYRFPNQLSSGNKKQGYSYKDQYKIVILGNNTFPARNNKDDVAYEALKLANKSISED